MKDRTRSRRSRKSVHHNRPQKPFDKFPLYAHPLGYWSKKINGTIRHFGRWGRVVKGKLMELPYEAAWREALLQYEAQVGDHKLNREPRKKMVNGKLVDTQREGLTVKDLCNRFLTAKFRLRNSNEITARTFREYEQTTNRLVAKFGGDRLVDDLTDEDFDSLRADIAAQWGPVRLANEITRVKSVFKHARKSDIIPDGFKKPSRKLLLVHRNKMGKKLFSQPQLRAMLDAASVPMRAMFLLGINCGFGNYDCGTLPLAAVDLENGWIDYPRPKTGVARRCPLWPETVQALKDVLAERPRPKDEAHGDLFFITQKGHPWSIDGSSNSVTHEARKLLTRPHCPSCGKINIWTSKVEGDKRLKIAPKKCSCGWEPTAAQGWTKIHRKGLGHYTARHTFRTVSDNTKDFPAVRAIMGHCDGSIDSHYVEQIDDSRLVAVVNHVRQWLFPETVEAPKETTAKAKRERKAKAKHVEDSDNESRPEFKLRIVG